MTFTLRPLQQPDDYARIAELRSSVRTEPILVADLQREDEMVPLKGNTYLDENGRLAGFNRERVVAVTADGYVIGFAVAWRAPFTPPGDLGSHLVVDAAYRKHGVGVQLLAHLENWGGELGAVSNEFTGVLRGHRGRRIATALKILAERAARRHNAKYMRTDNADSNAPMLAVNRKLGYVPVPGHYRIVKEFARS